MSRFITGSGSSGGGSSGSTATEDADTLYSKSYAVTLDLLGEGEWEEVCVGGLRGMYLDDVPVMNDDGTLNFSDVTVDTRTGTLGQTRMSICETTDTVEQVGVELRYNIPIERSISNPDTDIVRVSVNIPALTSATASGDVHGTSVEYKVEYKNATDVGWRLVTEGTRQYVGATVATDFNNPITGYSNYTVGFTINPWMLNYEYSEGDDE